jgi:hypothetical protein
MKTRFWMTVTGCAVLACSGGAVSSDEQARRAYLGLDEAVGKAMDLGFQGFNAASSANIAPQTASGAKSGSLTVTGQVDQGASANKGMRLNVAMTHYSDGDLHLDGGETVAITYDTDGGLPALGLTLRNIPSGTFTGSLAGDFEMSGDLSGSVHLDLMMAGNLQSTADGGTRREPGTTMVNGTATSGAGTYSVNLSL